MDVIVPNMARTSGFACLRKLFGNPAIRGRPLGERHGPVALRHWITPVLPLSESASMRFYRRLSTGLFATNLTSFHSETLDKN